MALAPALALLAHQCRRSLISVKIQGLMRAPRAICEGRKGKRREAA